MGKMNVAQFAGELGLPVELLLEQLQSAGVSKQKDTDTISEQDKSQLLEHLRGAHGAGKNKITLVRRETTAIKKADSSGKSRTIQVEVRKKRTVAPASSPGSGSTGAGCCASAGSGRNQAEQADQKRSGRAGTEGARRGSASASRTGGTPGSRCTSQTRAQQTQSCSRGTGSSTCCGAGACG